jgi:hypothetical protein
MDTTVKASLIGAAIASAGLIASMFALVALAAIWANLEKNAAAPAPQSKTSRWTIIGVMIGLAGLALTTLGIAARLALPEIRKWLGLD